MGSKREDLLEGAISCLRVHGYLHVTSEDVATVADAGTADIARYFGSLEHLMNVAVAEAVRRWLGPLVKVAAQQTESDPLERLRLTFALAFDAIEENRELVAGCLEAWAQLPRSADLRVEMHGLYGDFHAAVAQIVEQALASASEGGAPIIDANGLATLVIATFDGLLIRWQLDPNGLEDASRLVASLEGALAALRPQSQQA